MSTPRLEPGKAALEIRLKSGLLLGGSVVAGFHDATLRDGDDFPYFPASALKGAIREQLVRLVGEESARRILGGPGKSSLEEDDEAVAERLGGGSTGVYFTDATLADASGRALFENRAGLGFAARTQVAIDRRSRRSADKLLFQREILAPFAGEGLRFHAEVDLGLLDDADRNALRAAVGAVFAIGAGRTGGLGGVEMTLREDGDPPAAETKAITPVEIPDAPTIELELEALDPLCLGPDLLLGNFQRTLGLIPASALRGAVVTAALRAQGKAHRDQSQDDAFRELILEPASCLRFGDALPCDPKTPDLHPRPVPVTLQTCKFEGAEHGIADELIRLYLRSLLAEHGVFVATQELCLRCDARRVSAKGLLDSPEPHRRVTTRLGLDRASARAAEGQLFSRELLERGTNFVARVAGVGPRGREFLAAAASRTLRVGHGRGQGYGRMRITGARALPEDDLGRRLERFDVWTRDGLDAVARAVDRDPAELGAGKRFFAVTLWSDLVPGKPELGAERALLADLGLDGVERLFGQLRAGQRGGWDARKHRPKPYRPILRIGSTLLLATERTFEDLRPALAELELRGAGEAREEGFGWLRFSDPIHDPKWRKP